MGDLTELLAVDARQALMFFYGYLEEDVVRTVSQAETLYVASILAHYAQTSRSDTSCMPPAASLYEILDNFVLPGLTEKGDFGLQDPEILETAGSQTLLLVGFFRDQLKKTRHNLRYYDSLGSSFFVRASEHRPGEKKARMLRQVGEHFPLWSASCRNISRVIRDERYLLKLD